MRAQFPIAQPGARTDRASFVGAYPDPANYDQLLPLLINLTTLFSSRLRRLYNLRA
jgi:hypothetical protein